MIALFPRLGPVGAALQGRLGRIMEIILHIGAHRTGTTTFQTYLREARAALTAADVEVWGPERTRKGLFDGLIAHNVLDLADRTLRQRAAGRVRLAAAAARKRGLRALLVSDENMPGTMRNAIVEGELYPAIGERMARFARAFDGQVSRVVLSIRSPERYWASAMAVTVARGHPVPGPRRCAALAESGRSWRDVITDLACALPEAELRVAPFEALRANPAALLRAGAGIEAPLPTASDIWRNRAPDLPKLRALLAERGQDPEQLPDQGGPWQPFTGAQQARLRDTYTDDLFWLADGAEGLATLTEEGQPPKQGPKTPARGHEEGHSYDQEGRLGVAGGG